MTLSELTYIISNADKIDLFINNAIHPVTVFDGEIPDYFDDFEVTDIYAVDDTLVICIENEIGPTDTKDGIPNELPFV